MLSINVKKIEAETKKKTMLKFATLKVKCIEVRIVGYLVWSTHPIYSKHTRESFFVKYI